MRPSTRRHPKLAFVAVLAAVLAVATAGSAVAQEDAQPDPRAQVEQVVLIVAPDGTIWARVCFAEPWADTPPADLFSFFFTLGFVYDSDRLVDVGWETHAGQVTPFGTDTAGPFEPEMYILSDGCVLVNTTLLDGGGNLGFDVDAQFGSWVDEDTTEARFGQRQFMIPPSEILRDDPFRSFGQAVFDLMSMTPVTPPETEPSTTSTTLEETTTTTAAKETAPSATPAAEETEDGDGGLPVVAFIVVLLLVGGIAAVAWMLNRQGPAPDPGWGTADVDDDGGGYGTGEQQGGYGAGPDDDGDSSGYDQSGWNFGLDLDSDAGTDQPEGQPDHSGADDDQNLDPDPLEEAEINRRLTPDLPHGNLGDDLTKIAQGPLSPSDEMPDDPSERARWIRARIRDRLVDEYVRRPGVSSGTPPPEVLDLGDDVPLETKRLAHEVWQEIRAKYWPSTTSTQPDPLGESVPVDPVDDPDYDG